MSSSEVDQVKTYKFRKQIRIALYQCIRIGVDRPDIGLGIGALKSFLEHYSNGCIKADTFTTLSRDAFIKAVRNNEYDLVGISSVSIVYNEALKLIQDLNSFALTNKILLGGAHISCLPQTLPEGVIGVRGEGELTLLELCWLASEERLKEGDLSQLKGVFYWSSDKLKINPPRELVKNIDVIPPFNRDYFTPDAPAAVFTIRGCPYDCDFCVNYLLWERKVRLHSPEWVIDDLMVIKGSNPDVRTVVFRDDIMMLFPERLKKLADLIRSNDQLNTLEFVVYGRVNCVNESIVLTLKSMNVKCILFGFESFYSKIHKINKS
jgi:radical SAM superfamily enzyme YgiQ (UPF0313 family)